MLNEINKNIIKLKEQLSVELSDLEIKKIRLELSGKDISLINKNIEEKKDLLLKLTSQIKDSFCEQTMLESIINYSLENQNLENSGIFTYQGGDCKVVLRKGYLVTVGGYTSVGKSWFILRMIKQFVSQLSKNGKILLWTMEMGGMDFSERIDLIGLTPEEMNKIIVLGNARNTIEDFKIYLQHTKHEFDIIFIDHINQFLIPKGETEYSNLCNITGTLNNISKNKNILVVQVAQINRNSINKQETVGLQNLRGSGSIEQDSNVVILLKKEDEEEENISTDNYGMIGEINKLKENRFYRIAKNRHGPTTGWIKDNFVPNNEEFKKLGRNKSIFETVLQNYKNGKMESFVISSGEQNEILYLDKQFSNDLKGEEKDWELKKNNGDWKWFKKNNKKDSIKDKSYYNKI